MADIEWTRQIGGSEWTTSSSVTTDSNNNVYITGNTRGSLDAGVAKYNGSSDAWVAKYNTHGNLIWTRQIVSSEWTTSSSVTTDSNNNVYITGETDGSLGGINKGSSDAWVAKYNTHGDLVWTRQIGGSQIDSSYDIKTDSNDNIYITGETEGSLGNFNQGNSDAWVAKYNTHGDLVWSRQIGGSQNDESNGVTTDSKGNVYITGYTAGSLSDLNAGILASKDSGDAWIAKYNTHGNLVWSRQFPGSQIDSSYDVTIDSKDNIYITGVTNGSLGGVNKGDYDAWIAKYNTHGDLVWSKQIGSSKLDISNNVTIDSNDNVYITGVTDGDLDGVNQGSSDAWIAKISQSHTYINRFQNSSLPGTYLFAGSQESQSIRDNFHNFIEEGAAFKVAVEAEDDLIRMNRFQNGEIPGTYLYAGEVESQNIRQNYPNFIEEGIAFYVHPGSANIGVDFYRFQNLDVPGTYIFVGEAERQNILANYPNFVEEGIAFEVEV